MNTDPNPDHCPDCGGVVSLDPNGARVCGFRSNGIDFACGWREEPVLELAERPAADP